MRERILFFCDISYLKLTHIMNHLSYTMIFGIPKNFISFSPYNIPSLLPDESNNMLGLQDPQQLL